MVDLGFPVPAQLNRRDLDDNHGKNLSEVNPPASSHVYCYPCFLESLDEREDGSGCDDALQEAHA